MPTHNGEINAVFIISTDITEDKEAENALRRSEKRYKDIFENSLVSLWEEDVSSVKNSIEKLESEGVPDLEKYFEEHPDVVEDMVKAVEIVDVNNTTVTLYGARSKEQMLGSLDIFFEKNRNSLSLFKEELLAIAEGGKIIEKETKGKTFDGRIIDLLLRISIPSAEEQRDTMLVAATDITAQKKVQEDLQKAVYEKESLMRELNHRVKNNLINVSALANLELNNKEKTKTQAIEDLIARIGSIEVIHELLYTGPSFCEIEADTYIRNVARKLSEFYEGRNADPVFHFDVEPVTFSAKVMTTIGIILSELITNSFKYAVVEAGFHITISLQKTQELCILTYSDSGRALSQNISTIDDLKQGTGILLIKEFVAGLEGTIELDTTEETTFTLSFPC
jgi:two-component sensor histidine kinase/PAS domain-containing protein